MTEISVRAAGPQSMVTYRVGGREYPMRTNRQCKVCMSPHRFDIEESLVAGRTYAKIVDSLPEGADLSKRNVQDHYLNNHMPLEVSSTRAIVEARAQQVGKRIEDDSASLVDGITLAQTVIQKTFEAIAKGEQTPDIMDGLRATKMLADLGEYDQSGGFDMLAMTEAFMVYHESAEQFMSPEQFEQFQRALESNPVLKALEDRYHGGGDTVPGTVVDGGEEDSP